MRPYVYLLSGDPNEEPLALILLLQRAVITYGHTQRT